MFAYHGVPWCLIGPYRVCMRAAGGTAERQDRLRPPQARKRRRRPPPKGPPPKRRQSPPPEELEAARQETPRRASLNYPEDFGMLSPHLSGATRGTRENRQRSASWSPDPLGSGPEEMPLAPEAPFANAQNLGAGSSSSPPGGWPSQKPRPHAPAHAHAHASPLVRVSMCRVGGLARSARSASQTNDANKRLQTAGVCKQWTG